VALDQGQLGVARQHLTESLRLSHAIGARLGVARALEAFAALTVQEGHAAVAVQLTAAAEGLRQVAAFPPLPARRKQRALTAARSLGEAAVAKLWAEGLAMTADAAVAAALAAREGAARDVISPATAARHVANILAKLGFTSRAQIAAWAAGNGSVHSHRPGNGATSLDGAPYDGLRPVTDRDHP